MFMFINEICSCLRDFFVVQSDSCLEILLDSVLVLLTGGSVEFLHHEADLSEDLCLLLGQLGLDVLSSIGVGLLGVIQTFMSLSNGHLSSSVCLYE